MEWSVQLIERCRNGDDLAIEELVNAHKDDVYRLALSLLKDPAEADSATQQSFVKAIERLDTFRGESAFSTWLYTITLNVCRGRLRRRNARQRMRRAVHTLLHLNRRSQSNPETDVIHRERDDAVRSAVNELDDRYRIPVVLRYVQGLRIADIAQVMGVTERTIYNRLRAAHEQLHGLLHDEGFLP